MEGPIRQNILKDTTKEMPSGSEVCHERAQPEMAQIAMILRKAIATVLLIHSERGIAEDLKYKEKMIRSLL